MKHCILLAVLLPMTAAVYSQQDRPLPLSDKNMKSYTFPSLRESRVYKPDTGKVEQYRKLLEAQRLQKGGLVTATYSHSTSRGKVYTLTPDHMPCLVPDKKAVAAMPNADRLFVPDNRNAMPRQRIIPEGEEKNKK